MQKFHILSDGKPGHLNQSRAFAELSGYQYSVVDVKFRNRLCKGLSYILDKFGLYTTSLFTLSGDISNCSTIVSAGSETYYANRTLASRLGARSISVMLPSGYRYDGFDLIIGQDHDHPPARANIKSLPINLCSVRPQSIFQPEAGRQYVGLVIGGPNKVFEMDSDLLEQQLNRIVQLFPNHKIVVATSRRTPPDIDELLSTFEFCAAWIYSDDPVNPIPDFLSHCDYVYITSDSTSMISEAVSYGNAAVEILPLISSGVGTKFSDLIKGLEARGCLHQFNGTAAECRLKIDLSSELKEVFG